MYLYDWPIVGESQENSVRKTLEFPTGFSLDSEWCDMEPHPCTNRPVSGGGTGTSHGRENQIGGGS